MNETHTRLPIALLRQLSHDLRSPINAISGTNALLLEGGYGELNEKQTRAMQRIERNSKRALLIIDQFMTYARASAGQYDLVKAPFEPRTLITGSADALRSLLPADVKLTVSIAEAVPQTLMGDAAVLARCVDALLCNAVAFTAAGSICVAVSVPHPLTPSPQAEKENAAEATENTGLVIDVTDTGTGIDAEIEAALFTPFAPGAQTLTPVPSSGCGLGLALCHALAMQIGGSVELVSTSDSGSHFRLRLPYSQ